MEIRNSYSSQQSFGSIKGNPKKVIEMLGDKAVELILEQKNNKCADIIIDGWKTKVVARPGFKLAHDLGDEFTPNYVQHKDWLNNIAEDYSTGKKVNLGVLDKYGDPYEKINRQFLACRAIAKDSEYVKSSDGIGLVSTHKPLDMQQQEKLVGSLIDLEL